jgi:hypothetical protein
MMGRRRRDQGRLFYEFRLDDHIPQNHLLRRIDVFVTAALADLHQELEPYYSDIGRPSVDPELMIRMLIVGYCYGIRSERRLTQEVELHLAYKIVLSRLSEGDLQCTLSIEGSAWGSPRRVLSSPSLPSVSLRVPMNSYNTWGRLGLTSQF